MLSVSIYEVLMIMLVACVLIKPQELPSYIANAKKIYRYFLRLKLEIYDIVGDETHIRGDDGKLYKSYYNFHEPGDMIDDVKKIAK